MDDGIDGDLPFMTRQPVHYPGIGLGGLTQNVGDDQESHSVSVDSDSMGTKNPFSGQARP